MIINDLLNSPLTQQLSPSISLTMMNQLPMLIIRHEMCQAIVSLQGAQLLFWQPANTNASVIWLSEKTPLTKGFAIRGGVPICWPHFANYGEPLHGFARLLEWQLLTYQEQSEGVELCLQLTNSALSAPYIDKSFCLTLTMQLGITCQMELEMAVDDLEITTALHSYFNISDISAITVDGLGSNYEERFPSPDQQQPNTTGKLTINQMVDRIYTQPEAINYIKDIDRTIEVTQLNATDVVVWNPWQEKCQTMPDMEDDGYQTMVCVETARITQPIYCIEKQYPARLGFKIALLP